MHPLLARGTFATTPTPTPKESGKREKRDIAEEERKQSLQYCQPLSPHRARNGEQETECRVQQPKLGKLTRPCHKKALCVRPVNLVAGFQSRRFVRALFFVSDFEAFMENRQSRNKLQLLQQPERHSCRRVLLRLGKPEKSRRAGSSAISGTTLCNQRIYLNVEHTFTDLLFLSCRIFSTDF